jgi:hypothetical protein
MGANVSAEFSAFVFREEEQAAQETGPGAVGELRGSNGSELVV